MITTLDGRMIREDELGYLTTGNNHLKIDLSDIPNWNTLMLTLVFENKYFVTKIITHKK